jgi:hypothetical protein
MLLVFELLHGWFQGISRDENVLVACLHRTQVADRELDLIDLSSRPTTLIESL